MTAGETTVQDVAYIYDSLNRLSQVQQGNVTEAAYTYAANGIRAKFSNVPFGKFDFLFF